MLKWVWLVAGLSAAAPDTLDLVVGNVTCTSCAVSIRSVLKQAGVDLLDRDLAFPYARVHIAFRKASSLEKAFKTLESIGYPPYVVPGDAEELPETAIRTVVVDRETLRVIPAETWLSLRRSREKSEQEENHED